ncbi:MAG: AAA family ATPase [Candidatus Micrarchaeia archaeon]
MITSLTLENWKSHSKSEFHFGKGTNVLLGRMGSGKSSVLDALCFALYGTFPKMSRRDQTVENLVSMGTDAPYATVSAEFEIAGKKYSVMRKIGKKMSEAEVREGGKLVQKGPKPVSDYVSSTLGVDYELFTRAIYSEQNKIDYLLSLNPRARKQEIDWLLGLGKFDEARDAAQSVSGKLSEQSELFSSEAPPEKLAGAEKKIAEIDGQKKEKEGAIAKLKQAAGNLQSSLKEKETSLAALAKLSAEWTIATAECERHRGALARLKKEAEGKEKPDAIALGALENARKEKDAALVSAKKAGRETEAKHSAAKSEIAVLESQKKTVEARQKRKTELEEKAKKLSGGKGKGELEGDVAKLKAEIDSINSSHAKLHAEMGEWSKAIEALSDGKAKCPVCDSDLAGGKAEEIGKEKSGKIAASREEAKKLAAEIAAKKTLLASSEKSLSELAVCLAELQRISSEGVDVASIQAQISAKSAGAAALEAEAGKSEKEIVALEKALDDCRKKSEEASRTAKLFSDLEDAAAKLKTGEEKLSGMKFSEQEYENARKAAEGVRLEAAKADADLRGEEKQLKLLLEMLEIEGKDLDALRQKENLAKKYAEAASSMAIYKNSLSAVQKEMRNLLVDEINQALAEIWPAVYPYGDYGTVKLAADEKDYQLLLQKGEGYLEVDSVASGGERACLCLALRIAFATVLTPEIGWLILDEPTHNLDSEAVSLLSEAIQQKIPSIVEQTFVITHDASLGESGDGTIFRLERDKGKNEPSKVEKVAGI